MLAVVFLAGLLRGQTAPPEFTAAGVTAETLAPGAGVSVYGHHLGPDPGHSCTGTPDYQHPLTPNPRNPDPRFPVTSNYPKELCGVSVWIGDKQAGLLYVAENLINLQIPQDSAESGVVEVRVVYEGRTASVTLPAGFETTSVSLDQPAYTDMAVWLKVKMPRSFGTVNYPAILGPAAFGCDDVEVRRDGRLLTRLPGSVWNDIGVFSGNPCGTSVPVALLVHQGRLPLHLLYGFDVPGKYEVRFLRQDPMRKVVASSEWTPVVVLPSVPGQREKWLAELRSHPPTDAGELVTDILPGVMGHPDDASLAILMSYLDHRERAVRDYAIRGLHYWPDAFIEAKLLEYLRVKGPAGKVIERLLQLDPELRKTQAGEIVKFSLTYLASDSPALIGGAIDAIRSLRPARDAELSHALLSNADHVLQTADSYDAVTFVMLLAEERTEEVHQLLWRYAQPGGAFAQVIGEIARFRDPADLPRLGAMLIRSDTGSAVPENSTFVVEGALYENFGAAAIPYLERVLREWPAADMLTRVSLRSLLKAGDAAGYQFLEQNPRLRMEMYSELRSEFTELKGANDDVVAVFVHAHSQSR